MRETASVFLFLRTINTNIRHPGEGRGRAYDSDQSPIPAYAGMTYTWVHWMVIG